MKNAGTTREVYGRGLEIAQFAEFFLLVGGYPNREVYGRGLGAGQPA